MAESRYLTGRRDQFVLGPPAVESPLVVEAVELPSDERRQGYPWKFYRLSDEGRQFLADHNLLQAEETLQRMYETITDKPEKMVKYENAPRPDGV